MQGEVKAIFVRSTCIGLAHVLHDSRRASLACVRNRDGYFDYAVLLIHIETSIECFLRNSPKHARLRLMEDVPKRNSSSGTSTTTRYRITFSSICESIIECVGGYGATVAARNIV